MSGLGGLGKALIVVGLGIAALGLLFLVASRFGLTRLPGDIVIERKNFVFYAPLGLMILLSVLLTILLNLFARR
jgi:hypothetical protein